MARNYIPVNQIVNDFVLTLDTDDYVSSAPDTTIRAFALRGIREMGFDMLKVVRSLKLSVSSNGTVTLPDDYVDWTKVGVCLLYTSPSPRDVEESRMPSSA